MSSPNEQPPAMPPRAIVIGHGDFAMGMVTAVDRITGQGGVFRPLSVHDLSLVQIEESIRTHLREEHLVVVFTDLQAGSASMASRRALRDQPHVVLVAGANLPMLLDFALSTVPDPAEAARHAAERGRNAIVVHGGVT